MSDPVRQLGSHRHLAQLKILAFSFFVVGPAMSAATSPLAIKSLTPEPNYALTTDPGDAAQLVDGKMHRFPFWTSREAVGWVNRTPVVIAAEASMQAGAQYALHIRTARQSSADIAPPRRVDIYCQQPGGKQWQHAGSATWQSVDETENSVINQSVLFKGCTRSRLQMVIHASGPFIMFDELSLESVATDKVGIAPDAAGVVSLPVANPEEDSRKRLEVGLAKEAADHFAARVHKLGITGSQAWLSKPWDRLGVPETRVSLAATTVAGEPARYVVGILNASSASRQYSVISESGSGQTPMFWRVLQGLAANGEVVFDALEPQVASTFEVKAGEVYYLLASEAPNIPLGIRHYSIADDKGWKQSLTVSVATLDRLSPTVADQPHVQIWAYSGDKPIWQPDRRAAIVDRLSNAGVNVFDIHPENVPQPLAEGDWEERIVKLRENLALYRGRGLVLLLLGPSDYRRLVAAPDNAENRSGLERWLELLGSTLAKSGYQHEDWALYLVDEPREESLDQLATVIGRLRNLDPSLHFYANPIASGGLQLSTMFSLWRLGDLVDYWQPRVGDAFDDVRLVLGSGKADRLWFYSNPPAPARAAQPACYEDLGRQAHAMGAGGFGFWSFSDTAGSSAWTDFDGIRSDWAVVYEGGTTFVSSRRWEAFQSGVRNFAILKYCDREGSRDSARQRQCDEFVRLIEDGRDRSCETDWN